MYQTRGVGLINFVPIIGIETLHFGLKPRKTLLLVGLLHLEANLSRYGRQVIQTLADGIGVEH